MKTTYILVLCAAIVTLALADKEKDPLYIKIHAECQNDTATHIDESVIIRHGNDEEVFHARLGVHTLCMNVKLGIQKPTGEVDLDGLKKDLVDAHTEAEQVDKIITDCGGITAGKTAEEAAIALDTCLLKYNVHGQHHH